MQALRISPPHSWGRAGARRPRLFQLHLVVLLSTRPVVPVVGHISDARAEPCLSGQRIRRAIHRR